MPSPDTGPGTPELFTKYLTPEVAAVVPDVAAKIDDVEEYSISKIREVATIVLADRGIVFQSVDVSRVALAARLRKYQVDE